MNREELKRLAGTCADFRRSIGVTQSEMAEDLGVTKQNVSHFENGRSTNLIYFCWYIMHGLEVSEIWPVNDTIHGKDTAPQS